MPVLIFVGTVFVGLMIIVAIASSIRARRGTAANSDRSSWMWLGSDGGSSGDGGCDPGSDGGGCDGGGADGGGGGD